LRLFLILIVLPLASFKLDAGAWGYGSFENDAAVDWVQEINHSQDTDPLLHSFNDVLISKFIDADLCSRAIVSAEVIASLKTADFTNLPTALSMWASMRKQEYEPEMPKLAQKALKYCKDTSKSELAQLWNESNSRNWLLSLNAIEEKLE